MQPQPPPPQPAPPPGPATQSGLPPAPPLPPATPPVGPTNAAWPGGPPSSWNAPAAPRRSSRRRWVIGCGLLLLLVIVGIGACTVLFVRSFGTGLSVVAASGGQIETFRVFTGNTGTTVTFQAARGIDGADGPRLACEVIEPTLEGTELEDADWVLVNRAGDVIASDETDCGP